MKRAIIASILLIASVAFAFSQEPQMQTRAESSAFKETSLYADVMDFLYRLQPQAHMMKITSLCVSSEGRMVPLVILSQEGVSQPHEMQRTQKPAVLIVANIHAGEVEGKEACLMLLREIVSGQFPGILDNQVLLIVPILNADGNDKIGRNRRDNGPDLAGVRPNGQNLDLNRDYLKLESPEIRGLVRLFNAWDPVLFVDMHTTNGSYHQHPVTYTTTTNPNADESLSDFMWQKLFPAVAGMLKKNYGFDSVPYGNFVDRLNPEKGWINDSIEPRYGTIYAGLCNRLTILDENYSYADFRVRVLSSLAFVKSILTFTGKNAGAIRDLVRMADASTARDFKNQKFAIGYRIEKLMDITVKSYEFTHEKIKEEDRAKYPPWVGEYLVKKTDVTREYRIPYLAKPMAAETRDLPEGYILMPFHPEVVNNLRDHGVRVERLLSPYSEENAQTFKIEKVDLEKNIYQGHVLNKFSGNYRAEKVSIPSGAFYISMRQPLARLIAVLLEPESEDSLAAWGFFNRVIVQQWTAAPGEYPVVRVFRQPPVPTVVE